MPRQRAASAGSTTPQLRDQGGSRGIKTASSISARPKAVDESRLNDHGGTTFSTSGNWNVANNIYGRRDIKYYYVSALELDQIEKHRNSGAMCFSFGGALLALGLGILKDMVFTDKPKTVQLPMVPQLQAPPEIDWMWIASPLILMGIILLSAGIYLVRTVKSLIINIKNETRFD